MTAHPVTRTDTSPAPPPPVFWVDGTFFEILDIQERDGRAQEARDGQAHWIRDRSAHQSRVRQAQSSEVYLRARVVRLEQISQSRKLLDYARRSHQTMLMLFQAIEEQLGKRPNRASMEAMREIKQGRDKEFASLDELYSDLGI